MSHWCGCYLLCNSTWVLLVMKHYMGITCYETSHGYYMLCNNAWVLVTNSYKRHQRESLTLPRGAGYRLVPQKNTLNTKQQFTDLLSKKKGGTSSNSTNQVRSGPGLVLVLCDGAGSCWQMTVDLSCSGF